MSSLRVLFGLGASLVLAGSVRAGLLGTISVSTEGGDRHANHVDFGRFGCRTRRRSSGPSGSLA